MKTYHFSDDLKKEDDGDVDVDSEIAVEGDDEVPGGRSAVSVAVQINRIMPRPDMDNNESNVENASREYVLTLDNVRTM